MAIPHWVPSAEAFVPVVVPLPTAGSPAGLPVVDPPAGWLMHDWEHAVHCPLACQNTLGQGMPAQVTTGEGWGRPLHSPGAITRPGPTDDAAVDTQDTVRDR